MGDNRATFPWIPFLIWVGIAVASVIIASLIVLATTLLLL